MINKTLDFSEDSIAARGTTAGLWLIKSGMDALSRTDSENEIQSIRDLVGVASDREELSGPENLLMVAITYLAFIGLVDTASRILESSNDKDKLMKLFFTNSATQLQGFYSSSPLTKLYFSAEKNPNSVIVEVVVETVIKAYEDVKSNTQERLRKIATDVIVPRMMNIGGGIAEFTLLRSDKEVSEMRAFITDRNRSG